MDKNSVIGLFLIGLILILFSIYNQPTDEEIERFKLQRDSIAQVENERIQQQTISGTQDTVKSWGSNPIIADVHETQDTSKVKELKEVYGAFASAAVGEQKFVTLENELIKNYFNYKGWSGLLSST